jgi:hypothetical protein
MRAAGFPCQAMRVVGDVEFAIAVIYRSLVGWLREGLTLKESFFEVLDLPVSQGERNLV